MAKKKYHLTPNGPKRCKASVHNCRYSGHYSSEESAIAASHIIEEKRSKEAILSSLQQGLQNRNPDNYILSGFTLDSSDSRTPRDFAEELDNRKDQYGQYPKVYQAAGVYRLSNGSFKPVQVQITRLPGINRSKLEYTGSWKITTKTTRSSAFNYEDVSVDTELDFSNPQETYKSLIKANEAFRSALMMSGLRDSDDMFEDEDTADLDKESEKMVDSMKSMIDSVESEAIGDNKAWERGIGYFKDSDGQTIRVNEDYKNSSFRGENFRRFIEDNHYYASRTPDAEISVSDSNKDTGASWTFYRKDGEWSLKIVDADGNVKDPICNDRDTTYSYVYYTVFDHTNPGNEREAHRAAKYVVELQESVESALKDNDLRVKANWEKEQAVNEERRQRVLKMSEENHSGDPSVIKKIFELFS